MSKPVVVRLNTGYDLVGEIEYETNGIVLKHPFMPNYVSNPHAEGGFLVKLIQWLSHELFADYESVRLDKKDVMFVKEASDIMTELYYKSKDLVLKKIASGELITKIRDLDDLESSSKETKEPKVEPNPTKEKRKLQ